MGVALAAAVLALLLYGPASSAQDRTPAPVGRPWHQRCLGTENIAWKTCPRGVAPKRCQYAQARVPLSYQNPDGKKITLALGRLPATDQKHKVTSAPSSGTSSSAGLLRAHPARLLEGTARALRHRRLRPEGHERQHPAQMLLLKPSGHRDVRPAVPGNPEAGSTVLRGQRARHATAREKRRPDDLGHMSTANVARDMDLPPSGGRRREDDLPRLLLRDLPAGESSANLFPGKVRAMTLDAVLDPKEWTTGEKPGDAFTQPFTYRIGSFDGSPDRLKTFLQACAKAGPHRRAGRLPPCAKTGCRTEQTTGQVQEETLARLRQEPVKVTDGGKAFRVTYQDAVGFTASLLYDTPKPPPSWPASWSSSTRPPRPQAGGPSRERPRRRSTCRTYPRRPRSSGRKTARNSRRPTSGWSGFSG